MSSARLGGRAAVAATAALLGASLAGGPLYVSAAGSEAFQVALANTCGADAGLLLPLPPYGEEGPATETALDEAAAEVPHAGEPVVTRMAHLRVDVEGKPTPAPVTLVDRTGQLDEVETDVHELAPGEGLVAAEAGARVALVPGVTFDLPGGPPPEALTEDVVFVDLQDDGHYIVIHEDSLTEFFDPLPPIPVVVAGSYADIPFLPEPSFWCGLRDDLRPSPLGDPPPPFLLVGAEAFAPIFPEGETVTWELRPTVEPLTLHQAEQLRDGLDRVVAAYQASPGATSVEQVRATFPPPRLPILIDQAHQVATVVSRTMAPIRLAGIAASVLLLGGAAVLVARERRRELHLRLLRGDHPALLGLRVAAVEIPAIVLGVVVGALLALLAVVTLGPTSELEPGAVTLAALATAAGAVAAAGLIAAVAGWAASRTVDRPAHRRFAWVPWELLLVGLAVASYLRLDRAGGVRLVGDEASGGDLLAQAFPLLALAAPLALCLRPLGALVRRSRRWGRGLPVPLLTGLRRVGAEPATSAVLVLATARAAGAVLVSTSMNDSGAQLLADKAGVALGADEVVSVNQVADLPAGLTGSVVARVRLRSEDGGTIDILGVDAATFPVAVRWRDDASSRSLASLLDAISGPASGALPSVVVGQLVAGVYSTPNGAELEVFPVETVRWFPGQEANTTFVVVDRDSLVASGLSLEEQVWLRDPPPDASDRLEAAGFRVGGVHRLDEVFDIVSFLAVRWSSSALGALGVMIAVAVVMAQLLVLDARRRSRQVAGVLQRPMGLRPGGLAGGILTELAVPTVLGTVVGSFLAVVVLRVAVPRLDTLDRFDPPTRVVLDLGAFGLIAAVAFAALLLLTAFGVVAVQRTRPMEVMRSAA